MVSAGDAGGENSPLRSFLLNQACDGFVCFLAALGDLGCEREVLGAGFERFKMFFLLKGFPGFQAAEGLHLFLITPRGVFLGRRCGGAEFWSLWYKGI